MNSIRKIILSASLVLATLTTFKCNAYDIMGQMYTPAPLRVFVSSMSSMGDLSGFTFVPYFTNCAGQTGIPLANCACNVMAQNNGLSNNGAVYNAWLSDSNTDALCNIVGRNGTKVSSTCGGYKSNKATYVDINFNLLFNNWDDIKAGKAPQRNIDTTELHTSASMMVPPITSVWTGTANGGTGTANNCANWSPSGVSGDYGIPSNASLWTASGVTAVPCANPNAIYCFEQP